MTGLYQLGYLHRALKRTGLTGIGTVGSPGDLIDVATGLGCPAGRPLSALAERDVLLARRAGRKRWVASVSFAGHVAGTPTSPWAVVSRAAEDELVSITVHPATAQRWNDVAKVFAGRGGSTCWCQRFRRTAGSGRSTELRDEIEHADGPVGLIAYVGDEPAGWSRVVPRTSLPGIAENRALQRLYAQDDADPAWWISCLAVRRAHRGGGVGVSLLRSATRFAHGQGAAVLDGHPVDVERLSSRPSPAAVFTGTMSMFTAAGFHEIGRTYPSRPVMRHGLDGAG